MSAVVQAEPFSVVDEYERLLAGTPGAAVATFAGYVREFSETGDVATLTLEHYPGMAEKVLTQLGQSAATRYQLRGWRIMHRYGQMSVNDVIVWVAAVADHRGEAFSACEYMMDTLKTDAPFWKRETGSAGARWVAAKASDTDRKERWSTP